jgi:hypothetical protein
VTSISAVLGGEHITATAHESPRVVVYGGKAQEICVHNPRAVGEMVGVNVLAAFYKCFNGADRVRALEHVMDLVHHAERIEDAHDDEAAGYTRDRLVVGFMLAGAMREVAIALNELHGTRLTRDVSLREVWAPLDAIRRQFEEAFARNIRNNFSMHLGEQQHYIDGIMSGKHEKVMLFETSGKPHGGVFREPWDALLRGHGIEGEQMDGFIGRTKKAHNALPQLLINLFRDVLELRGVPVEFRPGRRIVEPAAGTHHD